MTLLEPNNKYCDRTYNLIMLFANNKEACLYMIL